MDTLLAGLNAHRRIYDAVQAGERVTAWQEVDRLAETHPDHAKVVADRLIDNGWVRPDPDRPTHLGVERTYARDNGDTRVAMTACQAEFGPDRNPSWASTDAWSKATCDDCRAGIIAHGPWDHWLWGDGTGDVPPADLLPLGENVESATMGPPYEHDDGRVCVWHNRLRKWVAPTMEHECLRVHTGLRDRAAGAGERPERHGLERPDFERIRGRWTLARLAGEDAEDGGNGWDSAKVRAMTASWQDVAVLLAYIDAIGAS